LKPSLQSPAQSSKLQSALDAMRQQEAPGSDQKPDANAQLGDLEPGMIEA
jgi:hypothetical protein